MSLLNYTTRIDMDKTAAEIGRILSSHGAKGIMTEYDEGLLIALSFKINLGERGDVVFRLPCDWHPVYDILSNDPKVPRANSTKEQAVRTAWRIVKDWVDAQMALVETQMVTTAQVFLPYAVMRDNRTLSEHVAEGKFLLGDGN